MMEDFADAVHALCESLQDGCDDETTKEYSKAACRLALRLCIFELDTIGGTYNGH